jgi:hypothetical protein
MTPFFVYFKTISKKASGAISYHFLTISVLRCNFGAPLSQSGTRLGLGPRDFLPSFYVRNTLTKLCEIDSIHPEFSFYDLRYN